MAPSKNLKTVSGPKFGIYNVGTYVHKNKTLLWKLLRTLFHLNLYQFKINL